MESRRAFLIPSSILSLRHLCLERHSFQVTKNSVYSKPKIFIRILHGYKQVYIDEMIEKIQGLSDNCGSFVL